MARDVEELIAFQLATELKRGVYALIETTPLRRDPELTDQLRRASRSAPRLIAEGFGRYLPGDFSRYLRQANGELKEVVECLSDGIDRKLLTPEQVVPLRRLSRRASKAASGLIRYLSTAQPPNGPDRRRRTKEPRSIEPEPPEPPEPPEQDS